MPNAPPPASDNVIGNVITNVIQGLLRSEGNERIHTCTLTTICYSVWRETCYMQYADYHENVIYQYTLLSYSVLIDVRYRYTHSPLNNVHLWFLFTSSGNQTSVNQLQTTGVNEQMVGSIASNVAKGLFRYLAMPPYHLKHNYDETNFLSKYQSVVCL